MNIISWSGGKDSTVMLHYLLYEKNLDDFKVVFIDSTITVPETLDYLEMMVEFFGIRNQFVMLRPEWSFFQRLEHNRFWPAIRALWCREYLKRKPLKRYYRALGVREIHDYIGVSLADSGHRRKRYTQGNFDYRLRGGIQVMYEYPLLEWSDQEKEDYVEKNRIPMNPVYDTFRLTGCYYCPYYHENDFLRLHYFYPKLFEKLCDYEWLLGKAALPDFWISSFAPINFA